MGRRWAGTILLAVTVVLPLSAVTACTGDNPNADPDGASGSSATASNASPTAELAPIDAVVQSLQGVYDDNPYPTTGAIVVLRVGNDRRVFTAGVADVPAQRPFEETTRAPIASITKLIVATLAMKLVAAGRLDLRDTVEDHLPGVLPQGEDITVGDLMSHRSGVEVPWRASPLKPGQTWTPATMKQFMRSVRLASEPGTKTFYSNINYEVLALILEQVTGRRLSDLLHDQVFRPLGMTSSTLGWASPPGVTARGYVDGKDVTTAEDPDWYPGSGGIVSTGGDVDRFLVALSTGRIVPPAALRTMAKARGQLPADDERGEYGLGIWHKDLPCGRAWGHSGRVAGFATEAYTLADHTRSVVVIVNGGSYREEFGTDTSGYLSLNLVDAALCT